MKLFVLSSLLFLAASGAHAETCGDLPVEDARFEVGLSVESLLPSKLPNFEGALPAYGVVAALPWGKDFVELQVIFGSSPAVAAKLFTAAYRLNIVTPHLNGFALAGAHFLSYATPGPDRNFFGGFLGLGSTISMAPQFAIDVLLKTYFQSRPMLAIGGAFRLAL